MNTLTPCANTDPPAAPADPPHRRAEQDARQRIVQARPTLSYEERLIQNERDIDMVWWQNHRMWM